MSYYASFQGRLYIGAADALVSPGNSPNLQLALNTDLIEHYESQSGNRSLDFRMVKQKDATVSFDLDEWTKENLALGLYGSSITGTADSVVDEPIGGTAPVIGTRYPLAHPKVSNVVVEDSAGTPATLTAGTHYTVDTTFGAIQFLDVNGFTAPFTVSYDYGAVTEIGIFTQPLPERFIRLEGLNTAQANAPVLVELYRVALEPIKDLPLINDDLGTLSFSGKLLADTTKPIDAALGQYGRIVQI